ncbi:ankyrin repeat-containing domain protein [Aspergillus oleicola]
MSGFGPVPKTILSQALSAAVAAKPYIDEWTYPWPVWGTRSVLVLLQTQIEITRSLLEAGAEANYTDDIGQTTLVKASECAIGAETVSLLFDHGAQLDMRSSRYNTPVEALWNENTELVKAFLDRNLMPSMDPTSTIERMPLHIAAISNSPAETIKTLIATNFPPDAEDTNGWTPFPLRMQRNHRRVDTLTITLTSDAAAMYQDSAVEFLISHGTDLNTPAPGKAGYTPLHYAAKWANPEHIQLLLEKGALITHAKAQAKHRCTPGTATTIT